MLTALAGILMRLTGLSSAVTTTILYSAVVIGALWYRGALIEMGEGIGKTKCENAQKRANEQEIARQKEANNEIVFGKDLTIKSLQDELNRKNEEAINAQQPVAPVDKACPPPVVSPDRTRRINSVR